MKLATAIAMGVTLLCGAAWAQGVRSLAFYGDEFRTRCDVVNTEQGLVDIHMFLTGSQNTANTVTFYAPTPDCWAGAAWIGDTINGAYLFLGSTHNASYGITITFVGCRDLPVYLGKMSFLASGSEPCCHYDVLPGQATLVNQLRIIDCDGNPVEIPYTSVTINPDEGCPCDGLLPVATEESTWGRVKSLYR
jgi:hypothetical protein